MTDEAAELSAVGQASFTAAYGKWSKPDDLRAHLDEFFSEAAVRNAIDEPGCHYLLASNGDTVAGFLKMCDSKVPKEVPVRRAFELSQVYVLPDQQRFGIGGQLLQAAARFAAERAADGLWLTVWEDAPWAVNAYRKYGFEQVGMIDFKLGRAIFNDLLMWLPVKGRRTAPRSPS